MFTQLFQKVYKNGKTGVKRIEKYYVNDRVRRQESLRLFVDMTISSDPSRHW